MRYQALWAVTSVMPALQKSAGYKKEKEKKLWELLRR